MPTVVTNDGVTLNYADEGSGRPIVLIGGGGMAIGAWQLQREHLCADHRVISLDRRTHGASEAPAFGARMSRHAADVRDVLDALELDDVLVVGASMGASVIWGYVELYGTTRLRGIVSIDQTPKMINEGDWTLGMYDLTWSSLESFINTFPAGYSPFHKIPRTEVLQLLTATRNDITFDMLRPLIRDHAEKDWRDVLPLVDVPVLAIAGRNSPFWPCESSAYIAEQVKDGRLLVLEDVGHVPFLEDPDAVNVALAGFAA